MKKIITLFLLLTTHLLSHAQGGIWTWGKGDSVAGSPGNISTIGVLNGINHPDSRYAAAECTDLNGNFWL